MMKDKIAKSCNLDPTKPFMLNNEITDTIIALSIFAIR